MGKDSKLVAALKLQKALQAAVFKSSSKQVAETEKSLTRVWLSIFSTGVRTCALKKKALGSLPGCPFSRSVFWFWCREVPSVAAVQSRRGDGSVK